MTHRMRRYSFAAVQLACTLALALLLPRTAEAVRPEDFGFATIPTPGERPLLTLLVDFRDARFPEGLLAPVYYQNLLFATELGQTTGSVSGRGGFFDENSLGQFRFTDQGVFGPYRAMDNLPRIWRAIVETISNSAAWTALFTSILLPLDFPGWERRTR